MIILIIYQDIVNIFQIKLNNYSFLQITLSSAN